MQNINQAKNFFVHLGSMISLYATVILTLVLYFSIINVYFETTYYLEGELSSIRFAIAGLSVIVPILIILSRVLGNMYRENDEYIHSGIKKWISYLTVFVTIVVLASDLFSLIYRLLEGDQTMAFVYKSIAVFVMVGIALAYSMADLKKLNYSDTSKSKIYAYIVLAFVLVGSVVGIMNAGNPEKVRMQDRDNQRLTDLSQIQSNINQYYKLNEKLPESLSDMSDPLSYISIPNDPLNASYTYTITGATTYTICADFETNTVGVKSKARMGYYGDMSFEHPVGTYCFERKVSIDGYPVKVMQ